MQKTKSRRSNQILAAAVGAAAVVGITSGAQAATTYAWDGGAGTGNWQDANNWNPDGNNTHYNGTYDDRLNVNSTTNPLVYSSNEGATYYGKSNARGLVIGSSAAGTMTITGGTFSTYSSNTAGFEDLIGVTGSNQTNTLNISGGTFIGAQAGMAFGNSPSTGQVSYLNVNSGSATLTSVKGNATSAVINLDGGTLEANSFAKVAGTFSINLNGGTLTARQNQTDYFGTGTSAVSSLNVKSNGANIDTVGYNISIAQALLAGTPSGGLTKMGTGMLTLNSANTFTGTTAVKNGTLALGASGTISNTLVLGDSVGATNGTLNVTAKGSFSQANVSGKGTLNIGAGKTITLTGTLAPGFSLGQVDVTGDLVLGSNTSMEVAATNAADLVNVSGSITYGGALAITGYSGFNIAGQAGTYNLFDFASEVSSQFGSVSVGGTPLTYGSNQWTGSSGSAQYTFNEGTGVLSVVVPEPSSAASLLAAGALMSLRRKKRS